MLVVTFYTKNTPYEDEAKKLEKSLVKFQLPYKFYPVESKGDHVKNVQMKPIIILQALREHEDNIVWMDSDNIVLDYPSKLYDLDAGRLLHDFASVIVWGRPSRSPMINNWKFAANVMFFRNTPKIHGVVHEWADGCRNGEWSDHYYLMKTLLKHKDNVDVYYLPMEYLREVPFMSFGSSSHVILHNTVSRNVFGRNWRI